MVYNVNAEVDNDQAAPNKTGSGFNPFAQTETVMAEQESLHKGASSVLNAQKIVGDAIGPVLGWHNRVRAKSQDTQSETDFIEQTNQALNAFLSYIGEQSQKLLKRMENDGVSTNEEWVKARITSTLSQYAGEYYAVIGPRALDVDLSERLAGASHIEGVWTGRALAYQKNTGSVENAMAMTRAMGPVIAAYERFDFLQRDREAVIDRLANLLSSRVDQTLGEHPAIARMSQSDRDSLRNHLLYQGGKRLADAWQNHIDVALGMMRDMNPDERRVMKLNGYPLEEIEDRFEDSYRMIHHVTMVTLTYQSGESPYSEAPGEQESLSPTV